MTVSGIKVLRLLLPVADGSISYNSYCGADQLWLRPGSSTYRHPQAATGPNKPPTSPPTDTPPAHPAFKFHEKKEKFSAPAYKKRQCRPKCPPIEQQNLTQEALTRSQGWNSCKKLPKP
ncbi:hypothetical protein NBRC116598_29270 [Pseudophaeobacter arcticus]|uniref:Uncharacterized protein n=1 Tax=Pseudophaeobacter arcticus TaxID=385492 RepID=A0ABQ0ANS4_9RHOB